MFKKNIKQFFQYRARIILFVLMAIVPTVALAQSCEERGDCPVFPNPLKFESISEFLAALLDIILVLGTPIAVFFIIYSGFLFVTARGNEQKLTQAKQALLWAIVGTVVLLGAFIISDVIKGTIEEIHRDSKSQTHTVSFS